MCDTREDDGGDDHGRPLEDDEGDDHLVIPWSS